MEVSLSRFQSAAAVAVAVAVFCRDSSTNEPFVGGGSGPEGFPDVEIEYGGGG